MSYTTTEKGTVNNIDVFHHEKGLILLAGDQGSSVANYSQP